MTMNRLYKMGVDREDFFSNELSSINGENTYLRYWLEVMRDYPIATVALVLQKKGADVFASEVLKKAMQFHITKAVIAIAEELPRYLLFNGSKDSLDYYVKVTEKYQKLYKAELQAKLFSVEINRDLIRKVKSDKLLAKVNDCLDILDELSKSNQSYTFEMYYYELQKKRYELLQDEKGILELCKMALKKFGEKRFKVAPQVLFAFSYPQIPILIKQGKFNEAKKIITKWSRLLRKEKNDWFVVHSYYVILNFRKMDMRKVRSLLNNVTEYPSELVRERYELFQAFSAIFHKRTINPTRFVNNVYEFQKDKGGYNIAILVAQLMHLLKLDNDASKSKYIESVEAIDRYMYRHVKDDPRSNLFLKILLMIPKCNFERAEFLKKSKNQFNSLKELPIEEYSQSIEVEMVPYEALYNRVAEFLK